MRREDKHLFFKIIIRDCIKLICIRYITINNLLNQLRSAKLIARDIQNTKSNQETKLKNIEYIGIL